MSEATSASDGRDARSEAGTSPVDRVKAEVERAKQTAEEIKGEVSTALEQRRGGPPGSVDEAADRLAELRDALSGDLNALAGRLPDATAVSQRTRRGAVAVAGGGAAAVAAVTVGVLARRRRRARRTADAEVQRQAEALARALTRLQAGGQDEPDEPAEPNEPGRARFGSAAKLVLALVLAAGSALAYRLRTAEPPEVFGPGAIDPQVGPPPDGGEPDDPSQPPG